MSGQTEGTGTVPGPYSLTGVNGDEWEYGSRLPQVISSDPGHPRIYTAEDLEKAKQEAVDAKLKELGIGQPMPEGATLAFVHATPTLGAISAYWHVQTKSILYPMNTSQIPLMPIDKGGGRIAEMRNGIVQYTLDLEDGKHNDHVGDRPVRVHSIFWQDDDVVTSIWCIQKLAEHNRPIASGVYFNKCDTNCEPLIFAGGSSGTTPFRPNQCFESWGWAQGLSLVNLDVYRHMLKEMGDEMGKDEFGNPAWYRTPGLSVNDKGGIMKGGTEDFPFFARANRLGYRCMVDCTPQAFGWHYNLKEKRAYPTPQWEQYQKSQPIIWPGRDGEPDVIWGGRI